LAHAAPPAESSRRKAVGVDGGTTCQGWGGDTAFGCELRADLRVSEEGPEDPTVNLLVLVARNFDP
jgi:hypothetical protein